MVQEREKDILAAIAADLSKVSVRGVGGARCALLFLLCSRLFGSVYPAIKRKRLLGTPDSLALLRVQTVIFTLK